MNILKTTHFLIHILNKNIYLGRQTVIFLCNWVYCIPLFMSARVSGAAVEQVLLPRLIRVLDRSDAERAVEAIVWRCDAARAVLPGRKLRDPNSETCARNVR